MKLDELPVKVYWSHEQQEQARKLISDDPAELIHAQLTRPLSIGFRTRTWRERESEAIDQRALRRWIPRALRSRRDALRYRLAHAIYPFDEGG